MVTVATAQPAVFSEDGTGKGQGIIINADGAIAAPGHEAAAGDAIVIHCTGLGSVTPAVDAGAGATANPVANTANEVTLTIGGVRAEVLSAELVPGSTRFYQVKALVPEGVTPGDAVELVLTTAGLSSPPVTMAVRRRISCMLDSGSLPALGTRAV